MGLESGVPAIQRAELELVLKVIEGRKQLARAGLSFPKTGDVDAGRHWPRPYTSVLDNDYALILGRTKVEEVRSGGLINEPDSPELFLKPMPFQDPWVLITPPNYSGRTRKAWTDAAYSLYTTLGIVVETGTDTPLQGYAYYRLRSPLRTPPLPRLKRNTPHHPNEKTGRNLYPYEYEDTGGQLLQDIRSAASRFKPFSIDIEKPEASQRALEEQISYLIENLFGMKN